jgi:ubiquinone/menaquinone biosynthesis C-methylase UbiE
MRFGDRFYAQFKKPTGLVGAAVGHLMALKNSRRSVWVLELIRPQPGERILEVGFGPGADATKVLAAIGPKGFFAGADVSDVMLRQATFRNRLAVSQGRADLRVADIAAGLPWKDDEFDAVYSINCAQFWPDLASGLCEIERVLRRGGRAVVAVQPRGRGASAADTDRWATRFTQATGTTRLRLRGVQFGPTVPPVAAVVLEKS